MNIEKKSLYAGCVTDCSYYKALLLLSPVHRASIKAFCKYNKEYEKALDIIFSVGRLPKYYAN